MRVINRIIGISLLGLVLSACNEPTKYVNVGPNWDAVQALQPPANSFKVEVKSAERIADGELIRFKVRSEEVGRLWVFQIDPKDEASPIFPIRPGQFQDIPANEWVTVPPQGGEFDLVASPPYGPSIIAAVVTAEGTDISAVVWSLMERRQGFQQAMHAVAEGTRWGIDRQIVEVTEAKP